MGKIDTIAGIATALSEAGIGVIRLSGTDAVLFADKHYRTKSGKRRLKEFPSHTIHYGYFLEDPEKEDSILDEVMVSIMRAPNSYTREDTVEINCHGSVFMLHKILEALLHSGVRLAEPGEFTKRAFLNGRIDLSQAEAVMELIQAKNQMALKNSMRQLRGSLHDAITGLRAKVLYEIAFIESALDDPEHISLEGYEEELKRKAESIHHEIDALLRSADNGKILKEGISTVILGKPNAGKSSVMNYLVGEEKAIVTDIQGTTRDILEEDIRIGGISLHMIDTAGIRETEDLVEQIGIERAKKAVKDAELILYVVDTSVPLDQNDREILLLLRDKRVIILFNKSDLQEVVREEEFLAFISEANSKESSGEDSEGAEAQKPSVIKMSAREGHGIEDLEQEIKKMFFQGGLPSDQEVIITNMRHKEALMTASGDMKQVLLSIENHMPEDFYSIDLMSCYRELGKIIGEEVEDDLVEEIFSKFCMGK